MCFRTAISRRNRGKPAHAHHPLNIRSAEFLLPLLNGIIGPNGWPLALGQAQKHVHTTRVHSSPAFVIRGMAMFTKILSSLLLHKLVYVRLPCLAHVDILLLNVRQKMPGDDKTSLGCAR